MTPIKCVDILLGTMASMSQEPPIADALVSIPSGQAILLARGPNLI
jgi:hypothetical protein